MTNKMLNIAIGTLVALTAIGITKNMYKTKLPPNIKAEVVTVKDEPDPLKTDFLEYSRQKDENFKRLQELSPWSDEQFNVLMNMHGSPTRALQARLWSGATYPPEETRRYNKKSADALEAKDFDKYLALEAGMLARFNKAVKDDRQEVVRILDIVVEHVPGVKEMMDEHIEMYGPSDL